VAQKKLVEHNALIQAIEMGYSKEAVMEKFGIKSAGALKAAYYDALVALDKIPAVNTTRKKKKVSKLVGINSRGSIVIPKQLVDTLGLDPAVQFTVEKNAVGLHLSVVKKPSRTILKKKSAG